jgi:hypothetical protein
MVRQNPTAECEHTSKSEVGNNNNHHKNIIVFMSSFLIIGVTLLLSSTTIMINAQAYSPTAGSITNISNNNTSGTGTTGAKQMGICVVGAGGPCNADSNWDGTHDVTGQCVLLNGCGNDNTFNKNTNNAVSGR